MTSSFLPSAGLCFVALAGGGGRRLIPFTLEVLLMRCICKLRTLSRALGRYTSKLGISRESVRCRCLLMHLPTGLLFSESVLSPLLGLLHASLLLSDLHHVVQAAQALPVILVQLSLWGACSKESDLVDLMGLKVLGRQL